jgi:hypothetical protein
MLKLAADENLNGAIVRGLLRRSGGPFAHRGCGLAGEDP